MRRAAVLSVLALTVVGCSGSGDRATPSESTRAATSGSSSSGSSVRTDPARARALAAEGYVWGAPVVTTLRTMQRFATLTPVNHLIRQTALSGPSTRVVVSPNRDTLYVVGAMDVRAEPLVLTVPEVGDRYYTVEMLDMYTEAFAYVGTRATGGRAGTYALVGPGWRGQLPSRVERIDVPTQRFVVLGRVLVKDDADLASARTVVEQIQLRPLSEYLGRATVTTPPPLAAPAGTPQSIADAGLGFFDELGDALAIDPPYTKPQRTLLGRLAAIGVGPGRHPSTEISDPALRAAMEAGMKDGEARLRAYGERGTAVNGWVVRRDVGRYGENYLLRAAVSSVAWGANVAEEAVYPISVADAHGDRYDGSERYRLHFAAGGLLPAKAFWSLTLYGPDQFFALNAIDRYAIGDRTPGLAFNADGSLDIYVQHDPPPGQESNWLPSPEGSFTLMMRLYLPERSVIDGRYRYPPVERISPRTSSPSA